MTRRVIDTLALWHSLKPDVQAAIGAAAIAWDLSSEGAGMDPPLPRSSQQDREQWLTETDRYDLAADKALGIMQAALAENAPDAWDDDGLPLFVDLNPLGIRQCIGCGCTEDHACTPPCSWAAPTLCNACPPETPDAKV